MQTLFSGSAIFAAGFMLHLVWWRVALPRRQTKTLLVIFFAALAVSLAWLYRGLPAGELCHIALYVTSLILAYMITYSAVEADSPSLLVALAVARAGEKGLAADEIFALLDDHALVDPRLDDLLLDKMAVLENGRYRITEKGRVLAGIFAAHRALLGAGKGG